MKMTKRIVSILILVGILLTSMLGFGGSALAAGQSSGWYYVNTKVPENHTYSYIYEEPTSSKSKNLGRVNDGEQVYVYWVENGTGKKSSKWAYSEYDGITGYIRWDNLSVTKPVKSTPSAAPSKFYGSSGGQPSFNSGSGHILMSGNANIRSGAGRSYAAVGNIADGRIAEYLGQSQYDERPVLWYKINYDGIVGWVSSMYADLVEDSDTSYSERIDCEGWYIVDTVLPAGCTYSYLYDEPSSTHGKNLGKVVDGEAVHVYWRERGTGDQNSFWAYCLYDGIKGYIRWDNLY